MVDMSSKDILLNDGHILESFTCTAALVENWLIIEGVLSLKSLKYEGTFGFYYQLTTISRPVNGQVRHW